MSHTPIPVEPEETAPPQISPSRGRTLAASAPRRRWLVPIAVLAVAFLVIALLFATGPEPERVRPAPPVPYVKAVKVAPEAFQLTVVAHGTALPRTESDLVAEVRGRIIEVAPALEAGGFFESGEELLRLDGREYRIGVDRNRAAVKLAESENRLAESDARRRRLLLERGVASDADLEQFENRALVSAATLDQARANLAQAQLDLERTIVRAPFAGRVRARSVDLGQFVSPGSLLARIYAIDYSEVRLPIRTDELSFLDIPAGAAATGKSDSETPTTIELRASLGGRDLVWPARLVRTEGEIDLHTRMMNVVARVDDPHGRSGDRVPLPAGLFVRAEIEGRKLDPVYVLPTAALREGNRVYVIEQDRLVFRDVSIVRRGRDEVIVDAGLEPGDRVIVSPIRTAIDGMRVRAKTENETGDPE